MNYRFYKNKIHPEYYKVYDNGNFEYLSTSPTATPNNTWVLFVEKWHKVGHIRNVCEKIEEEDVFLELL